MGLEFLLDLLAECGGLDPSVEVVVFVPSIECIPLLEGFSDDLEVAVIIIEVLAVLELALLLDESPEVFGVVYVVLLLSRVKTEEVMLKCIPVPVLVTVESLDELCLLFCAIGHNVVAFLMVHEACCGRLKFKVM